MIQSCKECQDILKLFDELLPWDKQDLLAHIVFHKLDCTQYDKLKDDLGFVEPEEIDPVKEVIDNDLTDDVLDEMSDTEIVDYICHSYFNDDIAREIGYRADDTFLGEELRCTDDNTLKETLEYLLNNYKDTFDKIKELVKFLDK